MAKGHRGNDVGIKVQDPEEIQSGRASVVDVLQGRRCSGGESPNKAKKPLIETVTGGRRCIDGEDPHKAESR